MAKPVVGVDVGGTKISLRAATAGAVVADHTVVSGPWNELDMPGKAEVLWREVGALGIGDPVALAVGAHGCDTDEDCAALASALKEWTDAPVRVVNDALLLGPAAGVEDCVAVVVGTGSIVIGRDSAGSTLYAGGWGPLLGDEGSAWGLVREAVRVLARAEDDAAARCEQDPLLAHLERASGCRGVRELGMEMSRTSPSHWAAWGRAVFAAADAGSAVAAEVIANGACSLAGLVMTLLARGARADVVVAGGGVVVNQPRLADELSYQIGARTELPVRILRDPPVAGAVRIAAALAGDQPLGN